MRKLDHRHHFKGHRCTHCGKARPPSYFTANRKYKEKHPEINVEQLIEDITWREQRADERKDWDL